MSTVCSISGAIWARVRRVMGVASLLLPSTLHAQSPSVNVGLPAAGAIGAWGGAAWLERNSTGQEGGMLIDLGWLRGQRFRLQGEVSFLRGTLTDSLLTENERFTGHYYDLSVAATAIFLGGGPASRAMPYVLAGVGVHAMASAFGSLSLDQRYNTNRFGSEIGAGFRAWLGASGRRGMFVELRRVIADEVNRTVVRAGGLFFLGDLVRAARD